MKKCYLCKTLKELTEFHKASKRPDGLQTRCKVCSKDAKRLWIQNNRDKVAKNSLWSKYRLRPEDYDRLISIQEDRCALCDEVFIDTPHVDHDHACCAGHTSCGECVRGLLCARCNKFLGCYEFMIKLPKLPNYLSNAPLV